MSPARTDDALPRVCSLDGEADELALSDRQQLVLRAVVAAYVADAAPASSATVQHLLPVALSSASIRNTMAELAALGLIEKPHASAGRVPTTRGLRQFLARLVAVVELAEYERRSLAGFFEAVDADSVMQLASQLLSERTHQLGFALAPRIERIQLRHISLVRVTSDRVLVVLVPQFGPIQQRVIEEAGRGDQAELDQMAARLNERVVGRTLSELRLALQREIRELRSEARGLLARSLALGLRMFSLRHEGVADLVITDRLAVLQQPEFNDPERIRGILAAVDTNERLIEVLSRVLEGQADEVSISLGEDPAEPGLGSCAVVAVPYGGFSSSAFARGALGAGLSDPGADESPEAGSSPARGGPLGVLGVIGPKRMDYARIIPLVSYCSRLVTEKLNA